MACNLKDKSLKELNTYTQVQIIKAVDGKITLDKQGMDEAVQKFYDLLNSKKDFSDKYKLQFIQAFPEQMYHIITKDTENGYLTKLVTLDTPVDLTYMVQLNNLFEDLDEVKKFVTKAAPSLDTIKKEIKKKNESRNNVIIGDIPQKLISAVMTNNKARPAYPNVTTGQMAYEENPDKVSAADRDVMDPEKAVSYQVIKTLIWFARNNPSQEPVAKLPDGTEVAIKLLAKSIKNVNKSLLTNVDKARLKNLTGFDIIVAFVADQNGNILKFDSEGNISDKGKPVYQYIRPVIERNGKLFLGNTANKLYTLVNSEDLAKQELTRMLNSGVELTSAEKKRVRNKIKTQQESLLNGLNRLTKVLKSDQPLLDAQKTFSLEKLSDPKSSFGEQRMIFKASIKGILQDVDSGKSEIKLDVISEEQLKNIAKNQEEQEEVKGVTAYVLHVDGTIIGIVNVNKNGYITNSQIHPDARQRGLGSRLYNQVNQIMQKSDNILLKSDGRVSPDALALWQSLTAKGLAVLVNEEAGIFAMRSERLDQTKGILLPITGGSYGITQTKVVPLIDTEFADELDMIVIESDLDVTDSNSGYVYFPVSRQKAGIIVEDRIYLQRMDMPASVADKVAKILTTKLKFNNEELSPQQRLNYYNTFLSNSTSKNGIQVTVVELGGINQLQVVLAKDIVNKSGKTERKYGKPLNLDDPKVVDIISRHLQSYVKGQYPANMSYQNQFAENGIINKDATFDDFEFTTNARGNDVIVAKTKNYFDFITQNAKVDFAAEKDNYFAGVNAYLEFAIPEEFVTPEEEVLELGFIGVQEEQQTESNTKKLLKEPSKRTFITTKLPSRKAMLTRNINNSTLTFGIGTDFTTEDLNHVRDKAKNWEVLKLSAQKGRKSLNIDKAFEERLVNNLNSYGENIVLNIVGNHMGDLNAAGWTQEQINKLVYNTLSKLNKKASIQKIIVEGDSGVGLAVGKAAIRIGIPVEIFSDKINSIRVENNYNKRGYTIQKAKPFDYISRIFGKKWAADFFKNKKKPKEQLKPKELTDSVDDTTTTKGQEETKEEETKQKPKKNNIDDLLGDSSGFSVGIERSKDEVSKTSAFLDKIFTSKSARTKAETWWKNSPLNNIVGFARMTAVVNSDAYGLFYNKAYALKYGMEYDPSKEGMAVIYGDALSIDMYHEAYHVFSQLVLTPEQRETLYNAVRSIPKYTNFDNTSIEEVLSEDFRSYGRSQSTKLGRAVAKIFKVLREILNAILEITFAPGVNVRRVQDIPMVREIFDNLYTGNITVEVADSVNTVNPLIFKRAKQVKPVNKKSNKKDVEFTVDESAKAVDIMDTIMALTFQDFNANYKTSSGAIKILGNEQQKIILYKNIKAKLEVNKSNLEQDALDARENGDVILANNVEQRVALLDKMIDNYGNIEMSLMRDQKVGMVAFHLERSRFSILKKQYLQDIDDASAVPLFTTKEGNAISAKELTSEETMLFLTGIFKQERDDQGNIVRKRDEYGLPELENSDIVWNKLARVLQGSFDPLDIYNRLVQEQENYPEFVEILNMLPDPSQDYKYRVEFQSETKFWQDFKKPQIPYIQLTVNKTIEQKREVKDGVITPEKARYESRVSRANFNLYKILSDWSRNFAVASTTVNKYIRKDKTFDITNILELDKVVKAFSSNGKLIPGKAVEFLKALGIELDMSSYEIFKITSEKDKFVKSAGVGYIFGVVKMAHRAANSNNPQLQAAATTFAKNPLYYLQNGLPEIIEKEYNNGRQTSVKGRLEFLATIQNRFSDGFSNYSVLSPEKNKVWEHFVDNTVTRIVTSLNHAKSWQELTNQGADPQVLEQADPNGKFLHMRWLSTAINSQSKYSVLLNAMFDLDPNSETYGQKRPGFEIQLKNIGGTQLNVVDSAEFTGVSTANADVTTKFLQEMHTLLEEGVQEFMRHASKSTSLALTFKGAQIPGYGKNTNTSLYIDIQEFNPKNLSGSDTAGQNKGFNIVLGYLSGEAKRIAVYRENNLNIPGYNKSAVRKGTGEKVQAGEAFTIFDDVLSDGTIDETRNVQKALYAIIDKFQKELANDEFTLQDLINENDELRLLVKTDVLDYFELQSEANLDTLEENRYVDPVLQELSQDVDLSRAQRDKMLIDAFTWNSWIHNFETLILAYGDAVQYNHAKEEFHKRNAGLASGGRSIRSDIRARKYINSDLFKPLWAESQTDKNYKIRPYDGTFRAGIMAEYEIKESVYYNEYYDKHVEKYTQRFMDAGLSKNQAKKKAKEFATKVLDAYKGMELADGQGYISFEAYRMFKDLEGDWSVAQENLYKRIAAGMIVDIADIQEFFPPLKYQYFGNIQSDVLPVQSFHKFSLAPLIPTVIDGTHLEQLHDKMMREQIDYVTFQTGSKISQTANADKVVNEDGSINDSVKFTPNVIFAEFLKNQTAVPTKYKNVSIFSTQLRKLVLEGLYENGKIATKDEAEIKDALVRRYIDGVSNYTRLVTLKLLDDIGFSLNEDGTVSANSKESMTKLAQLIRDNLTEEDVLSDQLIDIVDVTDSGDLQFDLSFHPESNKIEKVLLSVINKTIIKQKVKGEALVQKSSAMYDGIFGKTNFRKGTDEEIKKYVGSNFLPSYHVKEDGNTAAMKVMISLQGDYENLLNLEYKGEIIDTGNIEESLKRLNEAIKDDEWLDANDGANRKAITMVGVRIPVQGLNSIEFMEIMHFLPPQAGNIIIPPAEIVAKSGADFDIDKLSIFMKHIESDGLVQAKAMLDDSQFFEMLKNSDLSAKEKAILFEAQKAGLENEMIDTMSEILALPENFVSLTTPNSTVLLEDIAKDLAQYVMKYNPKSNFMTKSTGTLSPTRILETRYNLYKHESNVVGKQTLGLGAIENTFNVLFNLLGAKMVSTYQAKKEDIRDVNLFLRHHKVDGRISLAGLYDVDNENKISDIISQLINGWVDVEKDAWVFFVQGNYEVAPVLLSLIKSGVPVKEAIYFVSQPLVREYVAEQRIRKSTFAEPLKRIPFGGISESSRRSIIAKYFSEDLKDKKNFATTRDRYLYGQKIAKDIIEGRKDDAFTEEEMYDLIKDSAEDETLYASDLSKAMFLHYLQIEDQMEGTKKLKLAANPDTTTMTDVSTALLAQDTLDSLSSEPTLDQELKEAMINDSVISSFFNNKLIESLGKELFSFRYDESFDYVTDLVTDRTNFRLFREMFGSEFKVKMPQEFRNDFISYMYQNAVRKYYIGDVFNSVTLNKKVPVKQVKSLRAGAFVKDGVLYVDENQIKADFANKIWKIGSKSKNSYSKQGLYPLQVGHFTGNATSNYQTYLRFVLERETLRASTPSSEFYKSDLFNERFEAGKNITPYGEAKFKNYLYEEYLALKALDNSSNAFHLFSDPINAYAIRYKNIVDTYELKDKFDVLKRIEPDINKDRTMFNLYLNDKDLDNFRSNLYTKNLKDLADRTVQKVDDIETNNYISDFFANMTNYAVLQSGITKSKYNFLGITNFNDFISTISPIVTSYLNADAVTKQELLSSFYNTFLINNVRTNINKLRFKDYLNESSMDALGIKPEQEGPQEAATFKFLANKVIPTSTPGVSTYTNTNNSEAKLKDIVKANPNVLFVYPTTYLELQGQQKPTGTAKIKTFAGGNSIPIVTGLSEVTDDFSTIEEKDLEIIKDFMKDSWEQNAVVITEALSQGKEIAFPYEGLGDVTTMPQDLFISLSRTLLNITNYVNPGSETSGDIFDQIDQEINDAEILEKFKNNPLKC